MALFQCPECNKEISDKAECCPHCGTPLKLKKNSVAVTTKRAGGKWEAAGFLLIVIGILCVFGGKYDATGFLFAVGFIVFLIGRFK